MRDGWVPVHPWNMFTLVVGMFVCVVLAAVVVGLVAIPARREGRDVLTPKGEQVVATVRQHTGRAADVAQRRGGEAIAGARTRVGEGRARREAESTR